MTELEEIIKAFPDSKNLWDHWSQYRDGGAQTRTQTRSEAELLLLCTNVSQRGFSKGVIMPNSS